MTGSASTFSVRRVWGSRATYIAVGLSALITAGTLAAQTASSDVYRVEEDWQLVVGDPEVDNNGPQVTCTISPADMNTAFCAFDINYHTQPDYQPGGLQIHTWDPTDPASVASAGQNGQMSTVGETVTWTQSMSLRDGTITFRILNGNSQTWGNFGGSNEGNDSDGGEMSLSLPTSLPNLDQYSPQVSLDNSGVCFASNLVNSLTLVAVRYYDANGKLLYQITNPQNVHPQD